LHKFFLRAQVFAMPDVFKIRVMKTGDGECQVFAECRGKPAESDGPLPIQKLVEGIVPFHKEMNRIANTRRAGVGTSDSDDDTAPANAAPPRDGPEEKAQALKSDLKITQEVGTSLFEFLFTPPIEAFFRANLEQSFGETMPIRLFVEPNPKLSIVPWETLYDKRAQGFLSLSRQTPLIRAVQRDPVKLPLQRRAQLRILGMVARPSDVPNLSLGHIDAEGEQIEMRSAMQELIDQQKVDLRWTLSGRQMDLEDEVVRSRLPWSVFHFIGHGGFDPGAGHGYLVIQEEDGTKADVLYPETLRIILVGENGPQLVVLNSCKGAFTSSGDLFSSVAADLTLAGVPAVVAMQFVVSDEMAKAFTRMFYRCLSKGDTIGTALALTRTYLKGKRFAEWAAPVLYLRSDDSPLFHN
jgi:hypothetical protein